MICSPCRAAGILLTLNANDPAVVMQHQNCKGGTWCDCAHKTDSQVRKPRG